MTQQRRSQAERRAVTKQALVDKATILFAARGFERTTLADVADEAGVSKGAVHHYFQNKIDLVSPVFAHCADALRTAAVSAAPRDAKPIERWRAGARAVLELVHTRSPLCGALVECFSLARTDDTTRTLVASHRALLEASLTDAIQTVANETGIVLGTHAQSVASNLIAWGLGEVLRSTSSNEPHDEHTPASLHAIDSWWVTSNE